MLNHTGTKTLETERLILRQFKMEDAGEMFTNWASEDAVTRFLTWPTHQSKEITKQVLSAWVSRYAQPDFYNRLNDVEDKWVVVPEGKTFSKEEITAQVNFQEQYFKNEIIMEEEK